MSALRIKFFFSLLLTASITLHGVAQHEALKDIQKHISYTAKPVNAELSSSLSLNGTWHFNPATGIAMDKVKPGDGSHWKKINVPGDWTTQSFKVKAGEPAQYFRTFEIPPHWKGQRIKLRADGIQSWCRIWVNNKYAGSHLGGFTAFEIDITDFIKPGSNKILIAVQNESIADSLASTTQYAAFQIGGIFRKIYLLAVPEINFSDVSVEAGLADNYSNGTLRMQYTIRNQGKAKVENLEVKYSLTDKYGNKVGPEIDANRIEIINSKEKASTIADRIIPGIEKWDCEHPNLYTLTLQLFTNDQLIETISQKIGFRTIEVIGNQVFVNGMPIKLHGSNRHETHPLTGRTLTPEICLQDVILFRNANNNYIRTSHYPPSEEFLNACDSLGIFVEVESPFCWVGHSANSKWDKENPESISFEDYILQATTENIKFNFNHPSVLMWSLANESRWSEIWHEAHILADKLDETRPKTFHDQAFGGYNNFGSTEMLIANYHYPGDEDPFVNRQYQRPLLYGEYCHINTYNRREILTDPGVRDNWGQGFSRMWEYCYLSKSILGAAIWAGIDDIFYLPDSTAVGYGEWGIIDGWRRPKPEYFHVKKAYSPVKIYNTLLEYPGDDGKIRLNVENRHDFSNFNELKFSWETGSMSGEIKPILAPRTEGILTIETGKLKGDEPYLEIIINSPRGFEIDRYKIPFKEIITDVTTLPKDTPGKINKSDNGIQTIVKGNEFTIIFDNKSGQLISASKGTKTILSGAPAIMLLAQATEECRPQHNLFIKPLNDVLSGWRCTKFECKLQNDTLIAESEGSYDESDGKIQIKITADGNIAFTYSFKVKKDINPRQYGIVFYLPEEFSSLSWKRKGIWTGYPDDHIGRETGSAMAFSMKNKLNLWEKPSGSWKDDFRPLGNTDFCSTKSNITEATISSLSGSRLIIKSDGKHSVRAFYENGKIGFLVADFNTGGGDLFFAGHHKTEDRPLKSGDSITGNFVISLR
jgi:beta-galactosidase